MLVHGLVHEVVLSCLVADLVGEFVYQGGLATLGLAVDDELHEVDFVVLNKVVVDDLMDVSENGRTYFKKGLHLILEINVIFD